MQRTNCLGGSHEIESYEGNGIQVCNTIYDTELNGLDNFKRTLNRL